MAAEHNDTVLYVINALTGFGSVVAVFGRKIRLAQMFSKLEKSFESLRDEVRDDLSDFRRELKVVKRAQAMSEEKREISRVMPLRNGSDE